MKKLYFGWTIFSTILRSMWAWGSEVEEKSHSPMRTRTLFRIKLETQKVNSLKSKIQTRYTYSSTQWPAVATHNSLIRAPPHRCVEENPKKDVLRTDTYNGNVKNRLSRHVFKKKILVFVVKWNKRWMLSAQWNEWIGFISYSFCIR